MPNTQTDESYYLRGVKMPPGTTREQFIDAVQTACSAEGHTMRPKGHADRCNMCGYERPPEQCADGRYITT